MGVASAWMAVELDVVDLAASVRFYTAVLGFTVAVDRPARRFACLTCETRVDVMLQAADGPGERLRTAELERPFGRGAGLVIPRSDVGALFRTAQASGARIVAPLEERRYDVDVLVPTGRWPSPGPRRVVNRQFVVADPDGYLLRFVSEGGT